MRTPVGAHLALALLRSLERAGHRPTVLALEPDTAQGSTDPLSFPLPEVAGGHAHGRRPGAKERLAAFCRERDIVIGRSPAESGLRIAYATASPDRADDLSVASTLDGRSLRIELKAGPAANGGASTAKIVLPFDSHDTLTSVRLKAHKVARDMLIARLAGEDPCAVVVPEADTGAPAAVASGPGRTGSGSRRALAALWLCSGFVQARNALRRRRRRVPGVVINFHRVADNRPDHWMTLGTERFDRFMAWLEGEYAVVSIEEMRRRLSAPDNREPLAAVTFDDGYRECATTAAAVLENRGLPAAFYVCSGFLDDDGDLAHDATRGMAGLPKMREREVRDLAAHGFEVGSHSVSHADFRSAPAEVVREEIHESKRRLERVEGVTVRGLSVPWGSPAHCRPEAFREAAAAGYTYVVSHFDGVNLPGESGPHVRRVRPPLTDLTRFRAAVEGWRGVRGLISRRPERIRLPVDMVTRC